MNSIFITGIPTAGKSHLAKKLSKKTGLKHVSTDSFRKEMMENPELKKWVNYYNDLDEENYYTKTPCESQWNDLVNQSEAFWPTIIQKVNSLLKQEPLIIEGVNLLPHLMAKDFKFKGIILLGESEKVVLERLKKNPRWGKTLNLQKIEAKHFYDCEGKHYKDEAEKYGYKTFNDSEEAEKELLKMIHS